MEEHTFDDLMNEIMMEMDEKKLHPTHAVLMQYIERYPAHRECLASFFATWAIQLGLTPVSQDDT